MILFAVFLGDDVGMFFVALFFGFAGCFDFARGVVGAFVAAGDYGYAVVFGAVGEGTAVAAAATAAVVGGVGVGVTF